MAHQTNIVGATAGQNVQLTNVVLDVFAEEILFAAQPNLRFSQIAVTRKDLSVLPGQSLKFLKYAALLGDSALSETVTMDAGVLSTSTLQILVGEHGRALGFSEALLRASVTDVLKDAAVQLGNHYGRSKDNLIRKALLTGTNTLYAKARTSRATIVATDTFDVDLIREIVELLATNKAPKFNSDCYFCFVHPHQAKALRKDSAWQQANLYASPENILNGEIGRIEDVRFLETTQVSYIKINTQDIFVDGVDSGDNTALAANTVTNVYQAIAVGEYAVGFAEALPVEMRDDGVVDFGRTHRIAWYSIMGAGLLEPGHSCIAESA